MRGEACGGRKVHLGLIARVGGAPSGGPAARTGKAPEQRLVEDPFLRAAVAKFHNAGRGAHRLAIRRDPLARPADSQIRTCRCTMAAPVMGRGCDTMDGMVRPAVANCRAGPSGLLEYSQPPITQLLCAARRWGDPRLGFQISEARSGAAFLRMA